MITETIYTSSDLEHGICSSCGEESDEILRGTNTCIDCIESEKFYQETMNHIRDDDFICNSSMDDI